LKKRALRVPDYLGYIMGFDLHDAQSRRAWLFCRRSGNRLENDKNDLPGLAAKIGALKAEDAAEA